MDSPKPWMPGRRVALSDEEECEARAKLIANQLAADDDIKKLDAPKLAEDGKNGEKLP